MSRTIGYLRVSTDRQDTNNQKLLILEHVQAQGARVDEWVELTVSSRRSTKERRIDEVLARLRQGDTLIVSELSRLGRSIGQIIQTVDDLIRKSVRFVAVKQGIVINGKQDIATKTMVTMFGLMAEIERDLISERTKAGLARARAEGKLLGRPKGSRFSKLDQRLSEITGYLAKGISKASIAKLVDVKPSSLHYFLKTRGMM